uniref:Uncharacterized protein n=1 Tax=Caenorhabditis tropicalis TaxID=1561998 RepID=A0A1I7UXT4_9PELO
MCAEHQFRCPLPRQGAPMVRRLWLSRGEEGNSVERKEIQRSDTKTHRKRKKRQGKNDGDDGGGGVIFYDSCGCICTRRKETSVHGMLFDLRFVFR